MAAMTFDEAVTEAIAQKTFVCWYEGARRVGSFDPNQPGTVEQYRRATDNGRAYEFFVVATPFAEKAE